MTSEIDRNYLKDLKLSAEREDAIYDTRTAEFFAESLEHGMRIYDIATDLTAGFRRISADALIADSRIIQTLRYSMAPTFSQMKMGQIVGMHSTADFENHRTTRGSKMARLQLVAEAICDRVNQRICHPRFPWLADPSLDTQTNRTVAKAITCNLAADQSAQTKYRTFRKRMQESAIEAKLKEMGYGQSPSTATISKNSDLNPGQYRTESRIVGGREIQKADIVFRSIQTGNLVLVEAKAVGVQLDATKRVKECCNKASDWRSSQELGEPTVVAVLAGHFTATTLANLKASDVKVVWEHRLDMLEGL